MTDGMRFWDERVVLGTEALRKSCTFSFRPFILSSGGAFSIPIGKPLGAGKKGKGVDIRMKG
jgi:hypothetical protein